MSAQPPRGPSIPPVYLIAALVVMALLHYLFPVMILWAEPWRYAGVAVIAVALGFGFWAVLLFNKAETGVVPFTPIMAFIAGGPYRAMRNPMYLAMVGLLLGTGVLFGSATPFAVIPVFIALIQWRFILAEEAMLAAQFGETYAEYKARVRRWL